MSDSPSDMGSTQFLDQPIYTESELLDDPQSDGQEHIEENFEEHEDPLDVQTSHAAKILKSAAKSIQNAENVLGIIESAELDRGESGDDDETKDAHLADFLEDVNNENEPEEVEPDETMETNENTEEADETQRQTSREPLRDISDTMEYAEEEENDHQEEDDQIEQQYGEIEGDRNYFPVRSHQNLLSRLSNFSTEHRKRRSADNPPGATDHPAGGARRRRQEEEEAQSDYNQNSTGLFDDDYTGASSYDAESHCQRRPEDDIPGTSDYNPNGKKYRRPEDDIPGPSNYNSNGHRYRSAEDDIPGPSNSGIFSSRRRTLLDDVPGPSSSGPYNYRSRTPENDILGSSRYGRVNYKKRRSEDDMPGTSDSYDEPIEGEELARLLRIANVSRYEAGLAPAPPRSPPYGPSPLGLSTSEPSSSDQSTSTRDPAKQTYIDHDFELAKRLQEEENRRIHFEDNDFQSTSSSSQPGPSNRGSQPYNPYVPSDWKPDEGNEGDNEGDLSDNDEDHPEEMDPSEDFLHKECARLYVICQQKFPDVFVPRPMTIVGVHPLEYIKGYKDVIDGQEFPQFKELLGSVEPPVPPGSPKLEGRPNTITTAYRVVRAPAGDKNSKKKLLIKIPQHIAFQNTKKLLKQDSGAARKLAFQADRPTAFQNFVKAHNEAIGRVPTKPLFADAYEDHPNAPENACLGVEKKRRMNALIDIESGEPEPSVRRIAPVTEEEEQAVEDDMMDADDEPAGLGVDQGVFAVPAVPLRIGQVPSREVPTPHDVYYETSPAGQRKIYEQRRKRPERPRLSLQLPLHTDEGPSTSAASAHRSRSPTRRGGSSVFSQDLMNRHPFLRRTDDEDSIFQMASFGGLHVDVDDPAEQGTSAYAVENNYPAILWKDPENMPMIDQISDVELRKMPAEYVDAIIEHQLGDSEKVERSTGDRDLEAGYLELCRAYIPAPCRVPPEVLNTRFEVYIRFPFFQRPLYVQNVLVALHIKDNGGNVLARVPEKYLQMSLAQFFKEGVKAWFGLRLTETPTNSAISNEQLEDSIVKHCQEVSHRLFQEVMELPVEEREEAEIKSNAQVEDIIAQPVSKADIAQVERYRKQFMEQQNKLAHRQQMKVVGNALSRYLPTPAKKKMSSDPLNRVRLVDAFDIDDDHIRRAEEAERQRACGEGPSTSGIEEEELTETQL